MTPDSLAPLGFQTAGTHDQRVSLEGKQTGQRSAPARRYTPLVPRPEGGAL